MSPPVAAALEPVRAVLEEHLAGVVTPATVGLLLRATARRAVTQVPPAVLGSVGTDPLADRAMRAAFVTVFRGVGPVLFGEGLTLRIRRLERALEEAVVPA